MHGSKPKLYLASSFQRKSYTRELADKLEGDGYAITSSWLYRSDDEREDMQASNDLIGIGLCDTIVILNSTDCDIAMTDDVTITRTNVTGGLWVEMGYALAQHKRIIVFGSVGNIFLKLPNVEVFPTSTMKQMHEKLAEIL